MRYIQLAVAAVVFVSGCGGSSTDLPPAADESVSLSVQVDLSAFPINQVAVEVTGPGILTPLAFNLTLASGAASGTIQIPAGSDRVVTVTAFDAAAVATHRGSVTISLSQGSNPSVRVTLNALQGSQPIEAHIGMLTLTIEPARDTIIVGDTLRLLATVLDANDDLLDVQVRWATLNPALAWVDTAGLVTARRAGEVDIVATYAGVGARTTLLIQPLGLFADVFAGGGTGAGGGADHTCALTHGGDAYCWGENTFGELGSSDSTFSSVPLPVEGGIAFASLSVGGMHNCGMSDSGDAHCWGYNRYGQLGDGSQNNAFAPVPAGGSLALEKVVAGGFTTCGLTANGDAFCWGWGDTGERADGLTSEIQTTPVGPIGLVFTKISVGAYHACGLSQNGDAYCWGNNVDGQLGVAPSTDPVTSPVAVDTPLSFSEIDAGGLWRTAEHTCALDLHGAAYCWGDNTYGQLGDGTTAATSTPTAVTGGLTFRGISTLGEFTCGIATDRLAYCWGRNDFGQLGSGSMDPYSPTPVRVGNGSLMFRSVSVGSHHACGVGTNGEAYCWGRNSEGALGDGTRDDSPVPVRVRMPD